MRPYPFTAVVGMPDLRLALVLAAISPGIGGVLVRGEKGTAKSTMVRALAGLLPEVSVLDGCRFSCDPAAPDPACPDGPHPPDTRARSRPAHLVELPVGAAEERVTGSLSLERALRDGTTDFQPGLLAGAHRGLLYVDEVNLLADHLVDTLLDAAAMGRVTVEREGASATHASRFVLIGTMNPEEGELRPQLLDRFGLTVQVDSSDDPHDRVEVVRRRLAYERDQQAFAARYAETEASLAAEIDEARRLLPEVLVSDDALLRIAKVCASFGVDGMRADIVTARTAAAHAAWCGRTEVGVDDIEAAARLALPHRKRRNPFDAPGMDEQQLEQALAEADEDGERGPDDDGPGSGGTPPPVDPPDTSAQGAGGDDGQGAGAQDTATAGAPYRARLFTVEGQGTGATGRRSRALGPTGRAIRAVPSGRGGTSPDIAATIKAAAHRLAGPPWRSPSRTRLAVLPRDLRYAVREGKEGNLVLFCVDSSGSMGARARMRTVKSAALSLLLDSYQRRDKVGLVTFRADGAELALPPTTSVDIAARRLDGLPTGGRTPLAEGLTRAADALRTAALREPERRPLLVVITDGRATSGADAVERALAVASRLAASGLSSVVLDCESGRVRLGLAAQLAQSLRGQHVPLEQLAAESVVDVVRASTGRAA